MAQHKKLSGLQGKEGVGASGVVGELDLDVFLVQKLHDGSHLTANKLFVRQVLNEGHDVK